MAKKQEIVPENTNGEVTKNINENEAVENKKNAKATEKVVAIPVDPLNKKETEVKITINGVSTHVKRGVQQTVSKEVYEMLVISGYVVEG